jgi:MFS family permease/thioredoxin-like negative regulator of GroEL
MQATATTVDSPQENVPVNSRNKVVVASLIGTAIEFFDFYIYATAAVIVFPHIFFPQGDPTAATLQSLATFAIAFVARPIGSALFGHFGDRIGRKVTLVASLLTMGISTVAIGLLPTYETIGILAPVLLALARFGQGLGLGGEWGGAALLATENAPARKRALYGSFPQLGAPIGFFFANGTFLLLSWLLNDEQFMSWGWRIPFIFSAVLVLIGLYVRVSLHETPVFAKVAAAKKQVKIPMGTLLTKHVRVTVLGTFIMLATYTLFYIMTVYSMTYSTAPAPVGLGLPRNEVLWMLMMAVIGFGVMVLQRAGFDPQAMPNFLEKLLDQARYSTRPPEILLTHPLPESRLSDARNRANQMRPVVVQSSEDFYMAKARILGMYNSGRNQLTSDLLDSWTKGNVREQRAAQYGRALQAMEASNYDEARKNLQPLLTAEPGNAWYLDLATDIDLGQKRAADAINRLKGARDLRNNPVLQLNLANAYLQGGQPQEASTILNRYTFTYKDDPNGWDLLAQAEAAQNHRDQELAARAEGYALTGRLDQAISLLSSASSQVKLGSLQQARYDARIDQLRQLQQRYRPYEKM